MKKRIAILAAVILVVGLMPVTAFAHSYSRSGTTTTTYSLCSVQCCTKTTNHDHDKTVCFLHSGSNGHNYHNNGNGVSHHH